MKVIYENIKARWSHSLIVKTLHKMIYLGAGWWKMKNNWKKKQSTHWFFIIIMKVKIHMKQAIKNLLMLRNKRTKIPKQNLMESSDNRLTRWNQKYILKTLKTRNWVGLQIKRKRKLCFKRCHWWSHKTCRHWTEVLNHLLRKLLRFQVQVSYRKCKTLLKNKKKKRDPTMTN